MTRQFALQAGFQNAESNMATKLFQGGMLGSVWRMSHIIPEIVQQPDDDVRPLPSPAGRYAADRQIQRRNIRCQTFRSIVSEADVRDKPWKMFLSEV